ncbi:MAG: homoserine O-acetyltransferase [Pseudomonadota bacterium]
MTAQPARLVSAGAISSETHCIAFDAPLQCESGASISNPHVAYRTWGTLNAAGDNAVLVCHALTGSADVDDWWPDLIGAGGVLDPATDFIVCSNVLGGCYGTTGPYSVRPDAGGERYGAGIGRITVRDMVQLQKRLLDHLGVTRVQLAIGPSLGGMQVLEWAASFPQFVNRIAPIGVSAIHSAWCIGVSSAQRAAIKADPNWQGGQYDDAHRPAAGLAAARMMAMVTYRSWENFESRFAGPTHASGEHAVSSYLDYQGAKLHERFDAASYVCLTQAMDSHDVGRGREGGTAGVLSRMQCPALVVSVSSDVLYPPREQRWLAEQLPNATYSVLDSEHGHDGFLIDTQALFAQIRQFRQTSEAVSRSVA